MTNFLRALASYPQAAGMNKPAFAQGPDVALQAAPPDARSLAEFHECRWLLPLPQPPKQLEQYESPPFLSTLCRSPAHAQFLRRP